MRYRLISIVAVLLAIIGWWGLYELTGRASPDRPGMTGLFFALLFLALTATLAPPAAYLNRRFAPEAERRDPARFVRHSAWGGLCLTVWAWLQMQRVLNVGFALVTALMFVALEFLIVRLRAATWAASAAAGDPQGTPVEAARKPAEAARKPVEAARKPKQDDAKRKPRARVP